MGTVVPATRRGTLALACGCAALCVSLPGRADAQAASSREATARAEGRVVDGATGTGIADAEVIATGADTLRARTDGRGMWHMPLARAGRYTIRARRIGYVSSTVRVELGRQAAPVRLSLDAAPLALDGMVVTAARRAQRLADVAVTTEVVTRADIERTGASDLASVLVEQTGIQLQGGHPAGTGVMLQGIGSERVLVLLDGQPLAGRISGVFDVSRVPTSVVERIEVVKGPQSTLYGTDAMGGVVNIITRSPDRDAMGASLSATGGTQARRDLVSALTFGRGAFGLAVDAAHRNVETTPGRPDATGALAARTDGALKARWAPDSTRHVEASVLLLDERQRWRTGTFYNFGDNRQVSGRANGSRAFGSHRLSSTFSASLHDHRSRASTEPRPFADDTGQRQRQRVLQGELLYNGRVGPAGASALDVGVQLRRDETETARVEGGLRAITTLEPFAQLDLPVASRLSIVPGVRLSHSAQWGTRVTPRTAARWRATDRLTLRGSVGDGFRAPDFKELFMFFQNTSAGYAVLGNESLRPESSRNVSAGAEWNVARGFVRGTVFLNRFRDFIETRPTSRTGEPPVYRYFNVDDGSTRGADLEAGVLLGGWRIDAGYGLLATRDSRTGTPLLGRPAHSGRLLLARTLPFALRASVSLVGTGRTPMVRDTTSGTVTSWRDAFVRTDVRVARALPGGTELVIGADNLFDRQPAEWAGFTGRHVYTALSWNFNRASRTSTP